jgi:lipopolysaccharide transport system permease protein
MTTFCALLPWQLFASTLAQSSNSLVDNAHLLTKVYFPRVIVPMSAVLSSLVDFAIGFVILLAMMAWYGIAPGWQIVTLPIFLLLAMAAALGVGLWLSTLNVKYRDVRYTIPFLVQIWMILSPVVYDSNIVKPAWRTLYAINPMVGVVNGFKWALLGTAQPPGAMLLVSALATIAVLIGGLFYFRRGEKTFADVV